MPVIPAALVVVVVGAIFLFRRTDVRLVLMLSAAAMFLVRATQPDASGSRFNEFAQFFVQFGKGMIYAPAVIPICSAMGFAYVCKLTGCDAHLVNLLCEPLRHVRWLLIPGGIAVAYFVNSAIVSQTSTVSVVGPVLIPILVGAGISRQTAGALLLLGGSMGGELMNPAAVELGAISKVVKIPTSDLVWKVLPYNLLASGTALLLFWVMALSHERRRRVSPELFAGDESGPAMAPGSIAAAMANGGGETVYKVNVFKALVPLVPIILLVFVKRWIPIPEAFDSKRNPIGEQVSILAAMVIGVVCAGISAHGKISELASAFCEGAGFAYAHVISVIAAAMTFAESIQANHLIEKMTLGLKDQPTLVMAASIVVAWAMAMVTGTAVGTAPLVIQILLPIAMGTVGSEGATQHGVRAGALSAVAAQFGRTVSPVAPVVIMCATLAHSRPLTLVKRNIIPLLVGGVVLFVAALLQVF